MTYQMTYQSCLWTVSIESFAENLLHKLVFKDFVHMYLFPKERPNTNMCIVLNTIHILFKSYDISFHFTNTCLFAHIKRTSIIFKLILWYPCIKNIPKQFLKHYVIRLRWYSFVLVTKTQSQCTYIQPGCSNCIFRNFVSNQFPSSLII